MAENQQQGNAGHWDEYEAAEKHVRLLNTWATVVNALGLAVGLLLYEHFPWPATLVIAGTIALYGVIRLRAGILEGRLPSYFSRRSPEGPEGSALPKELRVDGTIRLH